ncbi:hypothetical protein BH11BAC4_BH11BAC4_18060 [soil metagenome]
MNWYLLKIVYKIICGDGDHIAQFDEQLRVVLADDRFHAFTKGRCIGENEQESFYNCNKKIVQWKFMDVSEIYALDGLADGAELYSRINEVEDAENYRKLLAARANKLLQETMMQSITKN